MIRSISLGFVGSAAQPVYKPDGTISHYAVPGGITSAELKAAASFLEAMASRPVAGRWVLGNLELTIELEPEAPPP